MAWSRALAEIEFDAFIHCISCIEILAVICQKLITDNVSVWHWALCCLNLCSNYWMLWAPLFPKTGSYHYNSILSVLIMCSILMKHRRVHGVWVN